MTIIKYVQDNDVVGLRQYSADPLDIRNRQATVQGDLMPRRSKATTVPGDPSTRTVSLMGVIWQSDMT
jgi:hypothetical protein